MTVTLKFFHGQTGQVRELQAEEAVVGNLIKSHELAGWVLLSQRVISKKPDHKTSLSSAAGREELDTAWWCREVRGLLVAGMTIVEAIDTLKAQNLGSVRDALHAELVSRLQEGQALSLAMKSTGTFPAVLVAGVKASERTSTLVAALDDYLKYHELLDSLKKKVISAAIYPSIVLALGLLIVLFLLIFVIPRFAQMYVATQPSGVTRAMLWLSQGLNQHALLVFWFAMTLMIGLFWAYQQGWLGQIASVCMESIGFLRRQAKEFRLAKLYQSMALMVRGGYAIAESLEQCAELELGPDMRPRLLEARTALERGKRISTALTDAGLTDVVTARLLAIAERTGNFDQVLQTVSQRHAATFITFVERTTRVVEPVMLLMASLLVGSVVVMMYMPVFDIAGGIR